MMGLMLLQVPQEESAGGAEAEKGGKGALAASGISMQSRLPDDPVNEIARPIDDTLMGTYVYKQDGLRPHRPSADTPKSLQVLCLQCHHRSSQMQRVACHWPGQPDHRLLMASKGKIH